MAFLPRRLALIAAAATAACAGALIPAASAAASNIAAPTLTGPANNVTNPVKDVVLTWDPVTGASKYQVQLSPNDEWTNNTVTLPDGGITINDIYDVAPGLPHAQYWWRVRALVGGTWGPYANPDVFYDNWVTTLTILKAPTSADPTVTWAPVPEASIYRVRFSTESNFSGSNTWTCFTAGTSYTPYDLDSTKENNIPDCSLTTNVLSRGISYFWEVRAFDDTDEATALVNGQDENDSDWDCAQSTPECASPAIEGSFTYEPPDAGSPTASTVGGLTTSWHANSLTATDCGGATACPTTPTFSWTPVPGANYYQVFVTWDRDNNNVYRSYDTAWPELTPRDNYYDYNAGTGYSWYVIAATCTKSDTNLSCADSDGGTPELTRVAGSAEQTFDKSSGSVSLTSPADGATLHGRGVTFSWGDFLAEGGQGTTEARNYDLEVATDPDFNNLVTGSVTINMTQFTDPAYAYADGTYYWRIAPIDEAGDILSWSSPRSFTIDATGPSVSITTKNGVALKGPLTIQFSEAVAGVNSTTVKVVPASGGSAVSGTLKLGSEPTIFTFHPSSPLVTGETYQLQLASTLVDANGNAAVVAGDGVRTATTATSTSSGFKYSSGWTHHSASGARSKGYKSAASGHSATLKVVGSKAVLYGCKAPSMGSISVSVGGKTTVVSEHQSFTRCGVALWSKALKAGQQTITVKVTHSKGNIDEVKVS